MRTILVHGFNDQPLYVNVERIMAIGGSKHGENFTQIIMSTEAGSDDWNVKEPIESVLAKIRQLDT